MKFGWVRDAHDSRDLLMRVTPMTASLPREANLRQCCCPVMDQGELGSCTANAIAAAVRFNRIKQGLDDFPISRLFIYYYEREAMGKEYISQDSGAMIRDGIKVVAKLGAPAEVLWHYDINDFTKRPSKRALRDAESGQITVYKRLVNPGVGGELRLQQLKACIAAGYPFPFGFVVFESMQTVACIRTGKVPMPKAKEQELGGHAVMAMSYDDDKEELGFQNSWGTEVGDGGFFTLRYEFVMKTPWAEDFWAINAVEED